WASLVWWLDPNYLWWMLPIVGALIVSIPLSIRTSSVKAGRRMRRAKIFLIPEETRPPAVMRATRRYQRYHAPIADFIRAVVDPVVNALACARAAPRRHTVAASAQHARLVEHALREGPFGLTPTQRGALLNDRAALSDLHFMVWSSSRAHAQWLAGYTAHAPEGSEGESAPRADPLAVAAH
ncbi:MAG TPA: glucan biosynthesis glucosyltransferase H, partial [Casimicrobiaceae bacterium]|nr:glucan biosynthesis glucosyltransferase H [Casimicrobiaceae bacterium]